MDTQFATDLKARFIKPEFYETLETISVRRFDRAMAGDLLGLFKRPEKIKSVPEPYAEELNTVWDKLYQEFVDRTMEADEIRGYLLEGQLHSLTLRYNVVKVLLKGLKDGRSEEIEKRYIEELRKWGYVLDVRKSVGQELIRLFKQLKNSLTKIKRIEGDLEEILGERKSNEDAFSLNKLKIKAQMALKIDIDLDRTSMDEWLVIWDEIDALARQAERQATKNVK